MNIVRRCLGIGLTVVTVGVLLFPLVLLVLYSVTDVEALQRIISGIRNRHAEHALIPLQFDFSTYWQVLIDSRKFAVSFLNSAWYSLASTAGQLLLAVPAAIALSIFKVKGRHVIVPLYMIVMMMPFQVTMVPNFLSLNFFKLLDSSWAIIVPQLFLPFSVVILYLFMIKIPREILEAAQVDGAGRFSLIWRVILPLVSHGIWAVGLLHFIDTWNMIEQPLVFLHSVDLMPLSIMIRQSLEADASTMFVPAVLFLLPVLIVYSLYHRYIFSGLQVAFVGVRTKAE